MSQTDEVLTIVDAYCNSTSLWSLIQCRSDISLVTSPKSISTLLAAIAGSFASFGVQIILFLVLRLRLIRIYQPKSYLVPPKHRVSSPPRGLVHWLTPLFTTSNLTLIRTCGLDAYFFLRFLQALLKFFLPVALLTLPVLLTVNIQSGTSDAEQSYEQLHKLTISNVAPRHARKRLWVHLVTALGVIMWFCYTIYWEMYRYIRIRQANLTSPQHRIRASATTVLVTGIPRKWLTLKALYRLYDVFPGGIKSIWLNRNFDELSRKVKERNKIAEDLETAETTLIKLCYKKHRDNEMMTASWSGSQGQHQRDKTKDDVTSAKAPDRQKCGVGLSTGGQRQAERSVQGLLLKAKRYAAMRSKFHSVENDLEITKHNRGPTGRDVGKMGRTTLIRGKSNSAEADGTISDAERHIDCGSTVLTTSVPVDSSQRVEMQIELPTHHRPQQNVWQFWKSNDHMLFVPSPRPCMHDEDEFSPAFEDALINLTASARPRRGPGSPCTEIYELAHHREWDEDQDGKPRWCEFIKPEDRQTIRIGAFPWLPKFLPFAGKTVDKIYHLRRELSRLNVEIENDQDNIEKYPLMNSAFIQFNQQIAAHMACQSLSHHTPQYMSPRLVEIAPNDVVWDNLSLVWWERYIRSAGGFFILTVLLMVFAVPVFLTFLLSNIAALEPLPGFHLLQKISDTATGILQGLLPPMLLSLSLFSVPLIFRALARHKGIFTGCDIELVVQTWYFAFIFIQVVLIAILSTGVLSFFKNASGHPDRIMASFAQSFPLASTYFFTYLLVQALSNSATSLLQIVQLFFHFVIGPMSDCTPRAKWRRHTNLSFVQWGSFFPPFANFAVIGIIYSVIAPLVLVFVVIVFGLFWVVYRYNILYVYEFRDDTGGLLFPTALNQLFTGVYFLELCLISSFFAARDQHGTTACIPQAVIMIIAGFSTFIYQVQLNRTFKPLFKYLPISLEDEAVVRDEAFARAQANRNLIDGQRNRERNVNLEHAFEAGERHKDEGDDNNVELQSSDKNLSVTSDIEAQDGVTGDVLYAGYTDELDDLSAEERNILTQYAFQHSALRARRPAVWIPRDSLGVSDDEIRRAEKMSTVEIVGENGQKAERTSIWMSNEGTALDTRGRAIFRQNPPDFGNIDLIAL